MAKFMVVSKTNYQKIFLNLRNFFIEKIFSNCIMQKIYIMKALGKTNLEKIYNERIRRNIKNIAFFTKKTFIVEGKK